MSKQQAAENLQQLAAQSGDMCWLAAYGNMPSRKMRMLGVALILCTPLCLAVLIGSRFSDETYGVYAVGAVYLLLMLFFWTYGMLGRRRRLEKRQQDTWHYEAPSRTLYWLDKGRKIAGYSLSDGDKLMAGDFEFHDEQAWVLAYRRPYPKQEVIVLSYLYGKDNDQPVFVAAAENIAANMRLPLEWSWSSRRGRLKTKNTKEQ